MGNALPIWLVPDKSKKFVKSRLASLPTQAPKCWPSQRSWNVYKFICDWLGQRRKLEPGFNYCRDCDPDWQNQMSAVGRCAHPLTTFVRDKSGIISGRRSKRGS